jgi:hypothetical protein
MTFESRKMSPDEFRQALYRYWEELYQRGKELKDPYVPLVALRSLYSKLDADQRSLANEVLGEWALSDSTARRYDALALISEFKVTTALPVVEELMRRFAKATGPSARHDLDHARRLAAKLMEHQGQSGAP